LERAGRDPGRHVFVELGAERGSNGILTGVTHPFLAVKTQHLGDTLSLSGECVVFSNELFDAQPCTRSVFRGGRWVELGVELRGDALQEVELETPPPSVPPDATEGYHFDQPHAAAALAGAIAGQPWQGLFVAFDYGKTLEALTHESPGGTVRAYYRHAQTNNILDRPGEQDLTCHVCWDWISDALRQHGFAEPTLSFQEAFFIRNAGEFIAHISAADAARFSQRKLALLQLLHPSQMGQKFQVLHAMR
jgi:SAM-dependent MidA family methyltransferase